MQLHRKTSSLVYQSPMILYAPLTRYSSVAYCDVTGRELRLPLRLKGDGMGPQVQFSFDTLDIQNIFVNSAHAYEVGKSKT